MLTKNTSYITKTEKYVKRRYSQALENNNQNEPLKKIRKIKNNKSDNDSDNISFIDDNLKSQNSEFQEFLKNFMIPCNIYKNLAIRHKIRPIILKRNLSYLGNKKSDTQKLDLPTIAKELSTVRFHDENLALMQGKSQIKHKSCIHSPKIVIKFDQFMDSKTEKDWQTLEASVYVDIIHFYRDGRKNLEGFHVQRVVSGQKIRCNTEQKSMTSTHSINIEELFKEVRCFRVHNSVFHFKILATERKIAHNKPNNFISFDAKKPTDEKTNETFPVTYEAMMPLHSSTVSDIGRQATNFCQPGRYQLFVEVTDMEKCDDSLYSGRKLPCFESGNLVEDSVNPVIDLCWCPTESGGIIDSPGKSASSLKNKAKVVFDIEVVDDSIHSNQKPMQTRNKSILSNNKSIMSNIQLQPICPNGSPDPRHSTSNTETASVAISIVYKFLVKDRIVQWTQTRTLKCPWCQLKFQLCPDIFDTFQHLLAHLNNWHCKMEFSCVKMQSRYAFNQAVSIDNYATINVRLVEPVISAIDFGQVLTERSPVRRMPFTMTIHSKYQKSVIEAPKRGNHQRLYNHTWSAEKLRYCEFDIDSEAEENQQWLFDQYYRKVEEFSDLNHIEKRVIQMWNCELLRHGLYVSDSQLKSLVDGFMQRIINDEDRLREARSMRNTLMLHLVNLVDFGVLSSASMLVCMKRLDDAINKLI